jgi:hypothetical protein
MRKKMMKHILTILIGLALLISCNNGTGQEGKRELVPNPEKYVHDGYAEQPDSIKPEFKPDTLIGQISLVNFKNVQSFLGENVMDRLVDNGLPNSSVISKDSKQRLTFYFHPGGVKNEFSEFKVNYVDQKGRDEFVTEEGEFITESGIKLGMTMGEFRAIKGEPDSLTNNETSTFHYRIDDFQNSEFLKSYNMPIYYADYKFKNGYLTEFRFGFEYP